MMIANILRGRCCCFCLLTFLSLAALPALAVEEPKLRFTYSVHSTLGLLTMEATTEISEEVNSTAKFRVPNRGFSNIQRYKGDGSFAYRLIDEDDEAGPFANIAAPMDWNGRHIFFFAFSNPGDDVPIRLVPMPENRDFRGQGAIIFGNYSQTPIAARLGTHQMRTQPGNTIWNAAVEAPDGMQTLIVKSDEGVPRLIYRNLIPVRENQRLFVMIVPGRNEGTEKLLVVFDRIPPRVDDSPM